MYNAIPIALVFIGCCSNVIFLELLVSEYPGSGNIITFCQFLFIAIEGFIFTTNFGTKKPAIPLKHYFVMVVMFFFVQVINNWAFNFNIAMTLHMIFRAGSLMANMVLGIIIMKKSYRISKYLAVVMISVGIALCTIASAGQVEAHPHHTGDYLFDLAMWLIGIAMLMFALFMSARMGIFQEQIYSEFGKHPKEALFYNHALPLPGFLLLTTDIWKHVNLFNQSAPLTIIGLTLPKMWFYLIGNVLTQYVCIRSVFTLTTECPSLTVTLVVTLRKFVSLMFSILYFRNPFTASHWFGAFMVFGGTLMFSEVIPLGRKPIEKKEH